MKKLNPAWGPHALENETAQELSNKIFKKCMSEIKNVVNSSNDFYEVRVAAFWAHKLGQWFRNEDTKATVDKAIERLENVLSDFENKDHGFEMHMVNAIREDIKQLQRLQKELQDEYL